MSKKDKVWCFKAGLANYSLWVKNSLLPVIVHKVFQKYSHTLSFTYCLWLLSCIYRVAAAAKSLQSCPTLCDPIDSSPPGSPVLGILQARTQEWVATSSSNAWKWKVTVKSLSCIWFIETPWTAAYQAPPSMGFSRQEYWSGVPLPSPLQSWVVATEFVGSLPPQTENIYYLALY